MRFKIFVMAFRAENFSGPVRGFGWAYKRRGLYRRRGGGRGEVLISGINKSFLNELIRNKLRLTKTFIKIRFPLSS